MKKRRATLKGIFESHSDAATAARDSGDMALVFRGRPRSVVMKCPDGCGETLTINLDGLAGKAWRLYRDPAGLTLFPSVWRDSGCRSHFILWDDVIYWFGDDWPHTSDEVMSLVATALTDAFEPSEKIAQTLNLTPWAVLTAARELVRRAQAIEGDDDLKGNFRTHSAGPSN